MSEVVGFNLSYDDTHTSLSKLLDRRVEEKMEQLQELSDVASREFSFEKMLTKMQEDWEGLKFELGAWKATGTHILKGGPVDEAQASRTNNASLNVHSVALNVHSVALNVHSIALNVHSVALNERNRKPNGPGRNYSGGELNSSVMERLNKGVLLGDYSYFVLRVLLCR
eukprot:1827723-Pyramimonas_sp.AAC.1